VDAATDNGRHRAEAIQTPRALLLLLLAAAPLGSIACLPVSLAATAVTTATLIILAAVAELVHASHVNAIHPPLVEENGEDDVIAETRHPVKSGHSDDECKQIVDESIERFVHEELPR